MKTDLYTKTVLTVIAIALVALFIQNANVIPQAQAQKSAFECPDIETICEKLDNINSYLEEIETNTYGNYCGGCPEDEE